MVNQLVEFQCPTCGTGSRIKRVKYTGAYTRRLRHCQKGHKFYTYQNGGGEIFDCYHVPAQNKNSTDYRQNRLTYDRLKIICDTYGNWRISACLERARQKAGVCVEVN